jgi:hypothetical protein
MATKASVRWESKYIRELLRQVEDTLSAKALDLEDAEELANELIASATVFAQWVNEQRDNN